MRKPVCITTSTAVTFPRMTDWNHLDQLTGRSRKTLTAASTPHLSASPKTQSDLKLAAQGGSLSRASTRSAPSAGFARVRQIFAYAPVTSLPFTLECCPRTSATAWRRRGKRRWNSRTIFSRLMTQTCFSPKQIKRIFQRLRVEELPPRATSRVLPGCGSLGSSL